MNKKGILAMLLALLAGAAQADDYFSPTEERMRVSLGAVYLNTKTTIQIDSSAGVAGTPVNAEKDFGMNKDDFEAKFQVMLRLGERNRVRFDYFSLDRTGNTTLDKDIIFRNVELLPNDPVNSNLSIDVLSFTYGYSFIHNDKFELAATIGINDTDLSTRARVATAARHVNQSEDQAGPFPTVGLDGTYVISKHFYLDARVAYFHANVDHLNGSLGFYELNALYRLRPNIAFALGYELVKAHLLSSQATNGGEFDFRTQGPELFVRVGF
jgi:opacity protein-like surface antigen